MHNIYTFFDKCIYNAIKKGHRRFAICPMGSDGILVKQILNIRYGIKEEFIIDNGLAKINPDIISVADLNHYNTNGLIILLNVTNPKANKELFESLLKIVPRQQILNLRINDRPEIIEEPEKAEYFKELRKLLKTMDVDIHAKYIRVGGSNDGGYIMLDDFVSINIAYSFGIGNDVTWDLDMAKRGIDVFQYDHTISALPEYHTKFHFNKIGIAGKDDIDQNFLSMETILNRNGHYKSLDMVLKMDVEGAEWDFLNYSITLPQFSQIVLELHEITDIYGEKKIINALNNINRSHQLVWIHGNNYGVAEKTGDIIIPETLEATYVRREDYSFRDSVRHFPMELDMPNNAKREDYILGCW